MNRQVDIPRLVRELRERTGITQEKLAARLGVIFSTINRWENGLPKPSKLVRAQLDAFCKRMQAATLSENWIREMANRTLVLEAHHTTHIEGTRLTREQAVQS